MKKEPNKKKIALFIIVGFIVMLGIVLKQVADKIIPDNRNMAVMYFSESIKGLSVGSPVVYEGVQVGKVVNIEIMTDPTTLEFSIPVYAKFAAEGDISSMKIKDGMSRREVFQSLINKGLRARLTNQNLLTGQLMIELQMLPKTPIVMRQTENKNGNVFEIPTTLSTIASLSKDLHALPIKQIVTRMDNVLSELETDLPTILEKFSALSEKLNNYADKSAPQTTQTLNQINRTLKDVSSAAKSVKNLTDYLEQHPDSIIKGK